MYAVKCIYIYIYNWLFSGDKGFVNPVQSRYIYNAFWHVYGTPNQLVFKLSRYFCILFLYKLHRIMFTLKIGTMGIRVTLIMNMFLHINYIYGTYIFEKDVSQMTGVGTAKEWLVFMEIRIKHCMKIRKMSRYAWGDLVGLTRCLATVRTEPQPRCYRDKYKWKVWLDASHHISIWRRIWKQHIHCKWIDPLNFTALVHGMFNINVTFLRFKMSDRFGMYPLQNYRTESQTIFRINTEGITCEFCGSHYPRSIYFAKNWVSFKLDTHREKYISHRNIIVF